MLSSLAVVLTTISAYSIGTPDCTTHLAEEVQKPEVNVPRAMFFQLILGFAT